MSSTRDRIEDIYPLSPLQQGILFHTLEDQGAGVYFEQLSWTLAGDLDVVAFRQAWQEVVDRHPVLRTAFFWEEGEEPFQVVHRRVELPWDEEDWRDLPPARQEERLKALLEADHERGFALSQAPLVRLTLIRLAGDRYRLVWSQHHILVDGWSLPLVLEEVFSAYRARRRGRPLVPEPRRPFRDYIAWLQQQDMTEAEIFWRRYLKGFPAPTPLAADRPPGREALGDGDPGGVGERAVRLPAALSRALRDLARRRRLTLNTVVQGAWALLLSRYSGQREVVFGATVSGRPADLPGAERMIGLFINTLPVRVRIAAATPVADWLRELQDQQAEMRRFEHSPLVDVQGWSEVPRGRSLFASILAFENFPIDSSGAAAEPGLAILDVRYGGARTSYPLTVLVVPGEEPAVRIFYDRRRFDPTAVERRLAHLRNLLRGLAAAPGRALAAVAHLSAAERQQLLWEWNDTRTDYPRSASIPELFAAQARRRPEAVALVCGERHLSYRELERRAELRARRLRRRGVGPEVPVALDAERSPETLVTLLGILKAGGAYLPLDPAYPEARRRLMLASVGPGALVADGDGDGSTEPEVPSPTVPRPEQLAYVDFTSGSTGEPKAVGVDHRAVVRLVRGGRYLEWGADDVGLALAPLSFDASTFEIWGPLTNGGRLVVAPPGALSLAEIGALVRACAATVLWLTAGLFRQMVEHQLADLVGLRALLAGGDVLPVGAVKRCLEALPGTLLINGYGPTENTTFTCCCPLREVGGSSVPIGTPIGNTRAYLLDRDLEPVPIGVVGELYAAGDGVARGYLGRPQRTAECFLPDPFSAVAGARLYRTGDLARYPGEQRLEFLGRVDSQVKVSGFRVEPGEIEAALAAHPEVAECAVVARPDPAGDRRLVAYLVWRREPAPPLGELRSFLGERLPEPMVPQAFVALASLPLAATGKLDRARLPEPGELAGEDFEAPRSPLEELLAREWTEVLGRSEVSVTAEFFALGGHSLKATQLVSRIRDALGVELSLREFFAAATVRALAHHLARLRRSDEQPPPLRPRPRPGDPPLSFAQQRLWFLDQLVPENAFYNMPAAIRLTGAADHAALERSLAEIVRRHETLRTRFVARDGQPVQRIDESAPAPLPRVDLRALPEAAREAEARRQARWEAERCFDLSRDRPLRVTLLALGAQQHVLLLTLHHIAADGWSIGIFARELAALYRAFRDREPSPLPELAVQYADFAVWQRRRLQGAVLASHLDYWKRRLGAAPADLRLPADRPRPEVATYRGGHRPVALSARVTARLEALSAEAGSTLFMTLLALWQIQLGRYSGQSRLAVGVPIANRNRSEIEDLIGFFVNTLVLSTDLSGRPGFRALLERVRELTLEAYDHQDLPFEKLVEELQPARDLSRNPLFQVAFALQNAQSRPLELAGLSLSLQPFEARTTRVDLEFHLQETPQGLRGLLVYDAHLFDATTIARMVGHWRTLAAGIAADPERCWEDLPLLSPAERQQLLVQWNDTRVALPRRPQPSPPGLLAVFAEQVERRPDAVAVVGVPPQPDAACHVSYRELQGRADRLAHHLGRRGVGPEVVVGLAVERSWEMVVGILGILKAGGAFLPLDPELTPHRLRFLAGDARAPVLVTREPLRERLAAFREAPPAGPAPQVVCLDREWDEIAAGGAANPRGVAGNPLPARRPPSRTCFPGPPPEPSPPDPLSQTGPPPARERGKMRGKYAAETYGKGVGIGGKGGGVPSPGREGGRAGRGDRGVRGLGRGPGKHVWEGELGGTGVADRVPTCVPAPEHPAYVMYTSGSTGRPKGVVVPHAGLVNVAEAQKRAFGAGPLTRVIQFAALSFDASVFEITMALGTGGTLILADRDSLVPGVGLLGLVRRHAVDNLTIPPSLLARMPAGELPGLATLIVAGDECNRELVARWAPGRRFFNAYGPTETTIWATLAACAVDGRPPSIGRPIANTRAYLLDRGLHPVPAGIPGEMYLGGAGLTRGYLGRPALTAERYLPDSLSGEPGARLYRTGDLARWRPDGEIDFLGRIDHQVKVRGFRIELGEIEVTLASHPAVAEAVVVVREEVPGDRQLAAYVVADPQYRNAGDDQLPAWQAEKVGHWRTLYERTYREPPADPDPTFNVVGWNSSYTGEPLPAAEMREWLDHTVAQILALSPRRVLEIGCGTGLVLFRIAPHCDEYLGTDFSAAALGFVRRHLGRLPGVRVRLEERLADDFEGIPEGSFDAVVLNSVVQYFPGVDYLLRVLEGAVRSLAPGGFLFVGDVRSLPLLATFHTSVTLARAPEELSCRELCARVQQLMSLEEELALDPEFFTALGRRFAGLAAPRIRLKRGRRRNELTNFRYDVILRLGAGPGDEIEPLWLDAPAAGWTIPQLGRRLQADAPPVLGLARVPNARLAEDVRALELLASGAGGETAGELRRACRAARDRGLDPEDLHLLAAERGYEMTAGWSDSGPEGRFDVRFTRGGAAPRHGEAPRPRPWASYANDPLQGRFLRQLVPELRDHLRERLPSYMVPAAFVLLDALPLNPSGKVDRRALPAPERPRSERDAAFVAPRTAVEKALAGIWCEVLRCPSVGVHDNFFELGGDSILSIQIVARARQAGLRLTPRQLFQARTLGELASRVEVAPAPRAEPEPVSGPVPLTPIQHWFFAQQLPRPEHWNQAFLLELDEVVSVPALARAVARLVRHHDVLRHRFARGPDGWQQQGTAPGDAAPFTRIELSALPPRVREEATTAAAARLQASLDLARGPLLRCALFDLGAGEAPRLLLVVHHLVVDAVSWRILLEDLWTVHQQLRRGEAVRLPAKTTSFRRWAERLAEYARSPELSAELEPWRLDPARVLPLPPELSGGAGTVASARTVAVSLGEEDTRVLQQELARRYRMQMHEIVLTALARAWAERTGGPLLVAVEGHGREEIFDGVDLTRTVGWFTTLFPVLLEPPHAAPRAALRQVKEALRRLPGRGLGYGVLRYLSREPTLADAPLPPVSFNHLGRLDRLLPAGAPLAPARQPLGPVQDPGGPRSFALEISSALVAGRLHLSWTYGGERCRRETIEQLASSCLATLRAFAVHARSPEAGGYTPSDFPGARLDQHRLDALTAAVEGGSARRIDDVYELAPVQQGMLFHTLYDPEPGMYFEQLSWTFRGELDLGALRRAWKALIAHHAVLRTSFHWQGLDQPVQVVGTEVPLPWEELDWRELERAEQERRFADRLRAEQERRFDLTRAPAMRLVLVRCAGDACRFIWSQHHILMDGWCFPLLMGELFTCYEAFRRGEDPRAEPPRPYRDYILWLARQDLARAAAAWREHLAGFTAPTPLAVDRPGDGRGVGALGWGEKRLRLPAATTAALRLLAARRLTLNTLFQGAWALLLSRYSGHRDVVFGATVAGRPAELAGSERMVGLFINTLPVRVEVAAEMPRDAWLRRLQEQQLELRRYEFTPLTEIRGGSEVPRDQPLFESLLVFENYPAGTPGSGEATLWLEDFRYSGARTNYPLTVLAAPAEELPLIAAYDRLRFADTTIARMLGHLRCLLEGLAADPGAPLAGLSLLAPGERHQLLCEWSEPGSEEPGDDADLGARIRAQVKLRPDAVAVVFGRERLSYRELDRRAERLARELFDLGAGADASVGVRLERSLELAVAVLAALKAGAPCLCLDPAYPEARLAFMLDDARVQVLVTRPQPGLAPPAGVTVLEIDGELRSPAPPPARPRPRPDDLLFIVYTSGSTGIPKGVGIPHRSLRRLVSWQLRTSAVAAGGVTLQFAALSFDVFFQELYATWCAGGTLAIISDNERRDPEALLRALARHAAQRLFLPFVALRQLAEAAAAEGPRLRLREVITAGEPLRITPSVRRWFARLPGCRLHNQYGPSESHVVTALALSGPADAWPVRPAIGRPVAAGRLHVTGPQLEAVAAGVAGELAIAGDCLARGYLGRPALSAERFVPDAFGRRPGGRLYRTGDLARLLADGTLEFLGRADHQVKVRGFRVEPGEIEAALAEHPAVREAVVDLRRDEAGEGRLVAYLVAHRPGLPAVRELRDFLRRTLPDYMLPALVVELPELPLTPSGKVDRRALPAPDLALAVPEAAAGTALSPVEDLVANVWAQVLGLPRVGVHDHFFELGGHSLLATRVISRLRQIFRVDLPLRSLFEAPTVAGLARRVEEAQRQAREIAVPPLEPLARDLPRNALPLSFAQQRLWFLNRLVPGNPFYNMPGALALSGPLDLGALERSLNELVRRHQTLRTTFPTVRGEAVQAIAPACFRPLPQVDLWRLPAAARQAELRRRTDAEVRRSFDLARGPLVRILLMRLGDDDNALVFTLHHVLADGWSIGVFTRELAALYQAFAAGRPSPLPELPIQYADFAVWQRRWLTGEALDRQLGYWKAQLQGAPQLALPTDRPRPPLGSFRGGIASCTLPLLRELEVLSQRHGCSLFMILLAAFKVLLWRHTSQDDIVVSTLIANRHHLELEGLIGFFANTLVLRTRLDGDPRFEELLARVREITLEAYAHQDLPFEKLVGELEIERDLSRNPLVQVAFILQNAPMGPLELPGLTLRPLDFELGTVRLDLEVHLWAGAEGLQVVFAYDAELFERATMETMLDHYRTLLERAVAAPGDRLSALAAPVPLVKAPAVQAPPPAAAVPAAGVVASSPLEKQVAAIFAEILGRDAVGLYDNFFALGGDSLRATQALIRVEELFEVELSLQALMAAPTVSTLTLAILEQQRGEPEEGEELLAELAELSDEEAERLFRE